MNRRNFFKALAVVPVVAIGGTVIANNVAAREDGLILANAMWIKEEERRNRIAVLQFEQFVAHAREEQIARQREIEDAVRDSLIRVFEAT